MKEDERWVQSLRILSGCDPARDWSRVFHDPTLAPCYVPFDGAGLVDKIVDESSA